jgi:hypothetical protein
MLAESRKPQRIIKTVLESVEIAGVVERRKECHFIRMIRPYPGLGAELPEDITTRFRDHGGAVFEAALVLLFNKARRYLNFADSPEQFWGDSITKLTKEAIEDEEIRWTRRYENWQEALSEKSRCTGTDGMRCEQFLERLRSRRDRRVTRLREVRETVQRGVFESKLSIEDYLTLRAHFRGRQSAAASRQRQKLNAREALDRINLSQLAP